MDDRHVMVVAHVMLSLALFAIQFDRACKTDSSTKLSILLSFWCLTAASILSAFAPIILPRWQPSGETLALLFSAAAVQWSTSRYWRRGTPKDFQNEHDASEVAERMG